MTTPDQPIVARDLKWAPIRHFTGARLARVGWLVAFTAVEDGSHRTCCASTHGHKSKPAAMACLRRTINRMIRSAR